MPTTRSVEPTLASATNVWTFARDYEPINYNEADGRPSAFMEGG